MTNAGSVLLIVIPLLAAFISIIKRSSRLLLILGVLVNVSTLFFVQLGDYFVGGYRPPFGIVLHVDYYSFYSLIVLNVLYALLMVLVINKTEKLAAILLITLAALNGLILTGDLFTFFVFLEIASIAAFIITSTNKKIVHVFNYMVVGIFGSSLYLLGLAILYSQYGTLNMAKMHEVMLVGQVNKSFIPIILIFVGLAVETKLLPFNSWVKGILENSDELVGPMIGSIYSGVMLIVFGRLFSDVFAISDQLKFMFTIIAVATMITGEIAAFSSKNIRQVLLYSSTAQSGLAIALILNGYISVSLLVILNNVVAKFVLYLIAGFMSSGIGTDNIEELGGIFAKKTINGLAFTIAGLSVISLPMFFGFFVKMNVLYNFFMTGDYVVPGIILVASLIESSYMIRMLVILWNPGKEGQRASNSGLTSLNYSVKNFVSISALFVSLVLVLLGIAPNLAIDPLKHTSGDSNTKQSAYTFILQEGVR